MAKPWIDISEFNTITDWSKVKKNVDTVIIRMGYRGSESGKITFDKKYKANRKACEDYKIPHGFYFFPTAITDAEAIEEADWVTKQLKGTDAFVLPLFADSEKVFADSHGRADKLSKTARTRFLRVFCDRLQANGIPAGVYASTNWLNTQLDMSKLPFSVWVAQYAPRCTYSGDYILWQYTSSGSVDGISGRVDMNVLHQNGAKTEEPVKGWYDAQKVIDIALAEVGYVEKRTGDLKYLFDKTANAGANNYTKYGYEMHQLQPINMDYPAAWCDCFVDWCFQKAYGVSNAKALLGGDFDDYTVNSANLYKKKNAWHSSNPKAGDQIFFKNSTGICHTGLVVKVENGYVFTVEGNTSSEQGVVANGGCVRVKSYPLNYSKIAGYGRPLYTQTVEQTTAAVDTSSFPLIKKGSTREDYVLLLQNALTLRGYPVEIDGVFGNDTLAKVKAFQKDNKLTADGEVGQKTWKALFS